MNRDLKCPQCGGPLSLEDVVCPYCGAPVAKGCTTCPSAVITGVPKMRKPTKERHNG